MTELYLIRHAQAEGNRYRMIQGWQDSCVTETGLRQIETLGERFHGVLLDAIWSSDLYRAVRTAEGLLTGHGELKVATDARLREIDMGPWTGRFFGDLLREQPEQAEQFRSDSENWQIEGAETFRQVRDRAWDCVRDIISASEGQRVAVVSHGITIRCLLWKLLGGSLRDTERLPVCRNTAVTVLRAERENIQVLTVNDASHLHPEISPVWKKIPDLSGVGFDPAEESEYYTRCYRDAWLCAHGSEQGFRPEVYLKRASAHHAFDREAVLKILDGEESVGLMDLDTEKGKERGIGWISLLYLREDYRGRGCGIQLLGRALEAYERRGRRAVQLTVAQENTPAVAFYEKNGFHRISAEKGAGGVLLLMERILQGRGRIV